MPCCFTLKYIKNIKNTTIESASLKRSKITAFMIINTGGPLIVKLESIFILDLNLGHIFLTHLARSEAKKAPGFEIFPSRTREKKIPFPGKIRKGGISNPSGKIRFRAVNTHYCIPGEKFPQGQGGRVGKNVPAAKNFGPSAGNKNGGALRENLSSAFEKALTEM